MTKLRTALGQRGWPSCLQHLTIQPLGTSETQAEHVTKWQCIVRHNQGPTTVLRLLGRESSTWRMRALCTKACHMLKQAPGTCWTFARLQTCSTVDNAETSLREAICKLMDENMPSAIANRSETLYLFLELWLAICGSVKADNCHVWLAHARSAMLDVNLKLRVQVLRRPRAHLSYPAFPTHPGLLDKGHPRSLLLEMPQGLDCKGRSLYLHKPPNLCFCMPGTEAIRT